MLVICVFLEWLVMKSLLRLLREIRFNYGLDWKFLEFRQNVKLLIVGLN